MDSTGHYLLERNPKRSWSRAANNAAPITPLLQFKKKYEVLKQNAFVPSLSKKRAQLTTSVRIGNVVYPVQAELYAAVVHYLNLNPPFTAANLKTAISVARQQLQIAPSIDVQMSRLPKMLDNHPRRTYLAGGGYWQQQLVPSEYPINFKLELVNLAGLFVNFNAAFSNQGPVAVYRISFIADDGVTYLNTTFDLFKNISGRQIISNSDWDHYLKTNVIGYKKSLIIVKPYTLDIYGGVYPAKIGFIMSHDPTRIQETNETSPTHQLYVIVMQGLFDMYKMPYPPHLDVGFQYLSDNWVVKKHEINTFLKTYNFNQNVNYKLLKGQQPAPQLA